MISYLVPSYNHADYLLLLLESIKTDISYLQVPAELIIIDDNSTDNSALIMKEWAAINKDFFPIYCVSNLQNLGCAAVLNQAVHIAQGDYLRLCSSDDLLLPGSSQQLYEKILTKPQLLCVFADGEIINEAGQLINPSSIAYHGGNPRRLSKTHLLTKELIKHWCIAGPNSLIKRSHYETMRFDEQSRIEDIDLFLSLLETPGCILFLNEKVYSYRIHSNNRSKTKVVEHRIKNLESFLLTVERYITRKHLKHYLLPLKYRTKAKIYFLQKKYLQCSLNMGLSLFFATNLMPKGISIGRSLS